MNWKRKPVLVKKPEKMSPNRSASSPGWQERFSKVEWRQNVLSPLAGFFAWLLLWFGGETILSAVGPAWYGVHQAAFEQAITQGGPFTANTTLLVIQLFLAATVSLAAGFLAAMMAGESRRAPLILGGLLLVLGLIKVTMSWPYVPIWHHVVFLALLIPMTRIGGKLRSVRRVEKPT